MRSHSRHPHRLDQRELKELPDDALLTINEVARLVRVSVLEVRGWIRRNEIRTVAIGNKNTVRIPRFEVRDFLRRRLGPQGALADTLITPG